MAISTTVILSPPLEESSLATLERTINQLTIEQKILSLRIAQVGHALKDAQLRHARIVNRSTRISRIPAELLSTIFLFARASQDADMDSSEHDDIDDEIPGPFELVISHVSSHFREVAIGTHRLWTSIHMRPGRLLDYTSTYIRRSGACPLDVRVDLSGRVHHPGRMTNEMLDIIIPHAHRWRSLYIASEREAAGSSMIARLCSCNVPMLEQLSVCVSDVEHTGDDVASVHDNMRPSILSAGAPKLSFLRLRGLAMHFFHPPLALVTTLHLDQTKLLPIQYVTFRNILTAPISLRHLSIYGDIIGPESWPGETSAIDLPALKSLRICGVGGRIYSGLLLAVSAPYLQSLVFKDVQEHDLDNFWERTDFSKFPQLQSVTFCDFDVSDFTYERMFRAFPSITEFTSFHSSLSNSPISKLLAEGSQLEGAAVPWPKLHTLTFLFDEDEECIHDMLERRKSLGYPLAKLRFGTSYEEDFIMLQERLQFQEKITLERIINVDKWPHGREYADGDDTLFL